jgi:hypothetical protein
VPQDYRIDPQRYTQAQAETLLQGFLVRPPVEGGTR